MPQPEDVGVGKAPERLTMALLPAGFAGALIVVAAGAFAALFVALSEHAPSDALRLAIGWLAVAGLFGPGMAVEAVAHERFQGDSFDPLLGRTRSRRSCFDRPARIRRAELSACA